MASPASPTRPSATRHSSKGEATRLALLDSLVDALLADGLGSATLRSLADAAGTSSRMLAYHFGPRERMVATALDHLAERAKWGMEAQLGEPRPLPDLMAALDSDGMSDSMAIWQEIVAGAARGDATLREAGHRIAADFLEWFRARLVPAHRPFAELALALHDGTAELRAVGHDTHADTAREALFALLPPAR